ncbi:MAG: hypothetical protein IPG50_21755 [Myxococcales bacterium]|nr:hypothetical protein [Myxococcales bacterium]
MTLRTGHGNGAGVPRIEVLPPDELPAPVPGVPEPVRRRRDGTVADPESAKRLGSLGGFKKAYKARLVAGLGLAELAAESDFRPFQVAADEFFRSHVEALALQAGGTCGPGPSTMVASAALQLASSRFLFARGAVSGDAATLQTASQLANASRQNLLAAYELAVREAQARKATHGGALPPWFEATSGETEGKP